MAYDSHGTLNKTMLIGRLGQDPELKYTPSGVAVLTLSIATNTTFKDQSGKTTENTEWHRVIIWRKLAEIINQYAKKGSRVYVEGRLVTRSWKDKSGEKKYTTEIQAESVQLLGSKNDRQDSDEYSQDPPLPPDNHPGYNEDGDELPF
jgi:single-strand DNA-binding protein